MSANAEIILTVQPRGVFHEGTLVGAVTPGMAVELTSAVPVGGRPSWQAFSEADGTRGLLAIATPDLLQGRTKDDAYKDGERVFVYCPAPGEEMNLRVDSAVGTGTSAAMPPGTLLRKGQGGLFESTATASEAVAVVSENFEDDTDSVNGTVQAIIIGA